MSADLDALKKLLTGRLLLFCHHNADPDAVCSAYALKRLAERMDKSVSADIVLTGGASRVSRRVMKVIGIEASAEADIMKADALIVLDTATLSQLEGWGRRIASVNTPRIFVDHHAPSEEVRRFSTIFLVDEESTSTCEMVYGLYKSLGMEPDADTAKALLLGIAYDSRHFTLGKARTFRTVSELLELDGPVQEVMAPLTASMDRPEKIARLKAAQRMQVREVSGWTVVATQVSSFQASAARSLISLGADVAVVAGGGGGIIKASMRSTERFHRDTRIHLGRDLAMTLGREFGGAGSGHSSSAGVNAKGNVSSFLKRALELVSTNLQTQAGAPNDNPNIGNYSF